MKTYRVDTVQTFYHSYLVSQPDEHKPEWCQDAVTCEHADEFTQKHLGEQIISYREVTDDEIIAEAEDTYLDGWSLEHIKKRFVYDVR